MKFEHTDCSECKKYQIGTCHGAYKMAKGGMCDIFEQKEEQMEELTTYSKSYEEYKAELGGELSKAAESFVRIGYLLKVARDTNVLSTSGYESVTDFAKAEFGIDKTQVSRFIHINDKFAENGYSDRLKDEYRGFGYSKLTIMLQLPDAINEGLSPEYSKSEIQAIKDEIDEEGKVTDVERLLEAPNPIEEGLENMGETRAMLFKTILQLGEDDPSLYVKISDKRKRNLAAVLPEIMAPSGDKTYSVRVRGIGRMMVMISDMSNYVKVVNSRSGEKSMFSWNEIAQAWIYAGVVGPADEEWTSTECWEHKYERKCPISPAKTSAKEKKEPRKETKVQKAPEIVEKTEAEEDFDEQIEGQTSLEDDFPQYLPENQEEPQKVERAWGVGNFDSEESQDGEENSQEDNEITSESEQITTQNDVFLQNPALKGIDQHITNALNTLQNIWQGANENKVDLMLDVTKDLEFRLSMAKRIIESCEEDEDEE